ncbi:MAG: hypothetical protein AVDCRST_MAG49-2796, partial [uncultured Thermomicrobiales bacterium]
VDQDDPGRDGQSRPPWRDARIIARRRRAGRRPPPGRGAGPRRGAVAGSVCHHRVAAL